MHPTLSSVFPSLALVSGLVSLCFFEIQVSWNMKMNVVVRLRRLGPEFTGTLLSTFETCVCLGIIASIVILIVSHCVKSETKKFRCDLIFYIISSVLMMIGLLMVVWYHSRNRSLKPEPFFITSYAFGAAELLFLALGAFGCCICRPRPRDDFYVDDERDGGDGRYARDGRYSRDGRDSASEMTRFSGRW